MIYLHLAVRSGVRCPAHAYAVNAHPVVLAFIAAFSLFTGRPRQPLGAHALASNAFVSLIQAVLSACQGAIFTAEAR